MTIAQNYKITTIEEFFFKIQSFIFAGKKIILIYNELQVFYARIKILNRLKNNLKSFRSSWVKAERALIIRLQCNRYTSVRNILIIESLRKEGGRNEIRKMHAMHFSKCVRRSALIE